MIVDVFLSHTNANIIMIAYWTEIIVIALFVVQDVKAKKKVVIFAKMDNWILTVVIIKNTMQNIVSILMLISLHYGGSWEFVIKIENVDVHNITRAIYSARNAMNSWDKSDSRFETDTMGENDLKLAKKLVKAGADHSKFMRMITVTCDITAPRYWWTEFDTYKVGTVRNSCSTMHTIHKEPFTAKDFSFDKSTAVVFGNETREILKLLNKVRDLYLKTNDKSYWRTLIQLLPQSYNQRATVQLNYQVLRNMYHARKNHKLDEWRDFCKWVEKLPYSELITEVYA